jgi:hypothetical protein
MSDPVAYFRAREDADRGRFFLSRNPELLPICAAWKLAGVVLRVPADLAPEEIPDTEAGAWLLLWECSEVDAAALVAIAGIDPANYRYHMRTLIAARLIYPDGSVPAYVEEEIQRASISTGLPKGLA